MKRLIRWFKRRVSNLASLGVVIGLIGVVAWKLFRSFWHHQKADNAAYRSADQGAKKAGKRADAARQAAHDELHEAVNERIAAEDRIRKIDERTRHGDADLEKAFGDWRTDRNERVRDD